MRKKADWFSQSVYKVPDTYKPNLWTITGTLASNWDGAHDSSLINKVEDQGGTGVRGGEGGGGGGGGGEEREKGEEWTTGGAASTVNGDVTWTGVAVPWRVERCAWVLERPERRSASSYSSSTSARLTAAFRFSGSASRTRRRSWTSRASEKTSSASRMKEEKDETSKAKRTEAEWKKIFFSFDRRESTWTRQERRAEPNDGRPDTGKEEGKDR